MTASVHVRLGTLLLLSRLLLPDLTAAQVPALSPLESPDPQAEGALGSEVSVPGDLTDDGTPDLAVAAWGQEPSRVYVFSGTTCALLHAPVSPDPRGTFGNAVSGVGDVNEDGVPDLLSRR